MVMKGLTPDYAFRKSLVRKSVAYIHLSLCVEFIQVSILMGGKYAPRSVKYSFHIEMT
jgi:hypothetical protein